MRVAFDLSAAAEIALGQEEWSSGLSRAPLETARALAARGAVELTCVGFSGIDPNLAAARVQRWSRTVNLPASPLSRSQLVMERTYEHIAAALNGGPMLRTVSGFGLAALKRLGAAPRYRDERYDVFHSTFLPLPRRSRDHTTACAITIYDLIPFTDIAGTTDTQRNILSSILASIDSRRDVVIAISEHTKTEVCEHMDIDPDHVVVATLAAANHFHPTRLDRTARWLPESIRRGSPFLLSVASAQPRKNVGHLVRAFGNLLGARPALALELVLVGGRGWLGDEVQTSLDAAPGLSDRVHRLGFVPDHILAQLYGGALAFVFPSRSEGFGLPVLEAMQSGAPTVVARAGAVVDIVGDAAVIVDPNDVCELSDVIADLVDDPSGRLQLRGRGTKASGRVQLGQVRRSDGGCLSLGARARPVGRPDGTIRQSGESSG